MTAVRRAEARRAWLGLTWLARLGKAEQGTVRHGVAWLAWLGLARHGKAWLARQGRAWRGLAGKAGQG